jgi:hypothetical protein
MVLIITFEMTLEHVFDDGKKSLCQGMAIGSSPTQLYDHCSELARLQLGEVLF